MNNVYVDHGYITIKGSDYYLIVNFAGVYGRMSLSDFGKMIKVVGSVLYSGDYYVYLTHWRNWLDKQIPTAKIRELPRLEKMLARVDKAIDKLPLWVIQDPDDRADREDPE